MQQQHWLLSIHFHFHCSQMRTRRSPAAGAEATLLDHCIIPWPYRRIPSEWALETNLAYISLGENYGIGFSAPSERASAAASEALFPSGLGGKRPRQLARGLLAFSSKMALASMAESKTTICVLVVTVLLGIGCLIGKKRARIRFRNCWLSFNYLVTFLQAVFLDFITSPSNQTWVFHCRRQM